MVFFSLIGLAMTIGEERGRFFPLRLLSLFPGGKEQDARSAQSVVTSFYSSLLFHTPSIFTVFPRYRERKTLIMGIQLDQPLRRQSLLRLLLSSLSGFLLSPQTGLPIGASPLAAAKAVHRYPSPFLPPLSLPGTNRGHLPPKEPQGPVATMAGTPLTLPLPRINISKRSGRSSTIKPRPIFGLSFFISLSLLGKDQRKDLRRGISRTPA